MEATVQTLIEAVDNNPHPLKYHITDKHKLINSFELRKACGMDGIPNE
jgi:hypothetical protein